MILTTFRSEESCRADLLGWGARWESNKNRPYFEGHERDDVVTERKKFTEYFLSNKLLYYYPEQDDLGQLSFKLTRTEIPNTVMPKRRILIAHDESTYRSGELPNKRWMFPELCPFYNKGA